METCSFSLLYAKHYENCLTGIISFNPYTQSAYICGVIIPKPWVQNLDYERRAQPALGD